ncbi:putative NADH:ubiquinone oxidoreductase, membrane subunit L [Candidatus Zinderia insecticola CARI]|uniref:Putative NADH:ubiquinone oxidoreductase, membrane subunit L n=1 Tax=Zinderia insecticola (strain CARI) TaxID=871271 RepID=E0TIT8_ZINIC|nr:putative NADH:ubiquinone oxidoreductase, membrane subunit L [Candidatus Zinderia insecticola CARI]
MLYKIIYNYNKIIISLFILPLLGIILITLFIKIIKKKIVFFITLLLNIFLFLISLLLFLIIKYKKNINFKIYYFIKFLNLKINFGYSINNLSILMIILVTFISLIVTIYSYQYIKKDKNFNKYFIYLLFFIFSMLSLVISNNILEFFFFWELLGLSSYLLINFWNKKKCINAGNKSFLINRIIDTFFIISIFLIYFNLGNLNFDFINYNVNNLKNIYLYKTKFKLLDLICLLLFISILAKSAQFPFHYWLPNTMWGPTPISALIHSATMVTSGIFLIIKLSFLFENSKNILKLIFYISLFTIFFSSLISIFQNDIKKIIAYSTISQLGYMVLSLSISCYNISIFHLIIHSFFKSLLFLCSGSIIENSNDIRDIRKLGNFKNFFTFENFFFLLGILNLNSFPLFSGFYSKNLIIKSIEILNIKIYKIFIYISSFMTLLYSFRMYFLIFLYNIFKKKKKFKKINFIFFISLFLLSIPNLFIGNLLYNKIIFKNYFKKYIFIKNKNNIIKKILLKYKEINKIIKISFEEIYIIILGIFLIYYLYVKKYNLLILLKKKFYYILKILKNEFYFNKILNIINKKFKNISNILYIYIEKIIKINFINNIYYKIFKISFFLNFIQNYNLYNYIIIIILNLIFFFLLLL